MSAIRISVWFMRLIRTLGGMRGRLIRASWHCLRMQAEARHYRPAALSVPADHRSTAAVAHVIEYFATVSTNISLSVGTTFDKARLASRRK